MDRERRLAGRERFDDAGAGRAGHGSGDRGGRRRHGQLVPAPAACGGLFGDQRADEARSAVLPNATLAEPVAVLGAARVRLHIAHPGPRAIVSVKLNDVSPAGESQPVTRGAVNVACAGEADVELELMATGWRFWPGHRIRVVVAANDWPCLWPLPALAPIEVRSAVELTLPGLPADARPHVPEGRYRLRPLAGRAHERPAVAVGDRRRPRGRHRRDRRRGLVGVRAPR